MLVAVTVPLRPGTHAHPEGTLMPVDRGGHRTAVREKLGAEKERWNEVEGEKNTHPSTRRTWERPH